MAGSRWPSGCATPATSPGTGKPSSCWATRTRTPRSRHTQGRCAVADLDEMGMDWVDACQQADSVGFCIRTTEDGSVRLLGLQLPPSLVANMLRTAAHGYEEEVQIGRASCRERSQRNVRAPS